MLLNRADRVVIRIAMGLTIPTVGWGFAAPENGGDAIASKWNLSPAAGGGGGGGGGRRSTQ